MTVPVRLYNSTDLVKYIIDAEELNTNFNSLSDGTGIDDRAILPRHLSAGATDVFMFPNGIGLNAVTDAITPQEGMIYYKRNLDGSGTFYGIARDEDGNLQTVVLG